MSSYIIPVSGTFLSELSDRTKLRYYRLKIDGVDITDKIYSFSLSGGQKKDYAQWSATLKNKTGALAAGDYADEPCTIEVKTETSAYFTIFTGFVSESGLTRERGQTNDDYVKIVMYDRQKSRGIKRKPDPAILAGFKVSNPSAPSSSIFHYLATLTGVAAYDTSLVDHTVPIVEIGNNAAWAELKKLAELYKADMYFRYDGALRFFSPFESSYSTPSSEWTFIADASQEQGAGESLVREKLATGKQAIQANRCTVEFNEYTKLDTQIIYQNTENYDSNSGYIEIEIPAGGYWPGDGSGDYAALEYKDPDTGEAYDFATDIVTPTIGVTGGGYDIEYTGGTLTLISFNGSTSATKQQAGASEIILRNTGGGTCRIRKFQLRGKPYRCDKENKVQDVDPAVTSEEEYVDKKLDGTFASTVAQAQAACIRTVEHGRIPRRSFKFAADWCPVLQRGAVCTLKEAGESDVLIKMLSFVNKNKGSQFYTEIEAELFDDSTTSRAVPTGSTTINDPAKKTAEDNAAAISIRPTYTEMQEGYTAAGGVQVPTVPVISVCEAFGISAIKIEWDHQVNLTNFSKYEISGSKDPFRLAGDITDGDETVINIDTSGLATGDILQGEGIPSGTTVDSITSATELEMSAPATATTSTLPIIAIPSGTQWYSLLNDGTDWKGALGATEWSVELFMHVGIPHEGTDDAPTGAEIFYRIRRITTLSVTSAWSEIAGATTRLVSTGDYAANSIGANAVQAGFLQALFALITSLYVGYYGSGSYASPTEGALSFSFQNVEQLIREYTNGAWSNANQIRVGGLDSNNLLISGIACRQWSNPLADVINQEFIPDTSYDVLNFEGNYISEKGKTFIAGSQAVLSTSWSKFGTRSLFANAGAGANAIYTGGEVVAEGDIAGIGGWFNITTLPTSTVNKVLLAIESNSQIYDVTYGLDAIYIRVFLIYDSGSVYLRGFFYENGMTTQELTINHEITATGEYYLWVGMDGESQTFYFGVNDKVYSDTFSSFTNVNPFTETEIEVGAINAVLGTSGVVYADYAIFSAKASTITDVFLQHYTHNRPWNINHSVKDLVMTPADGGCVSTGEHALETKKLFAESIEQVSTSIISYSSLCSVAIPANSGDTWIRLATMTWHGDIKLFVGIDGGETATRVEIEIIGGMWIYNPYFEVKGAGYDNLIKTYRLAYGPVWSDPGTIWIQIANFNHGLNVFSHIIAANDGVTDTTLQIVSSPSWSSYKDYAYSPGASGRIYFNS